MNRLFLTSILVLSTIAQAKAILPKEKLGEADYKALSGMNEDRKIEVRLISEGKIEEHCQELRELGVEIIGLEGERIAIKTTVEKLNKLSGLDWIAWIEKDGKEKKTRSASKPVIPSVISAQILCDNPPADYQTQIQAIGVRITRVEANVIEVEADTYEQLNRIAQLSYVMRIGNIMEIPVLEKEKEKE